MFVEKRPQTKCIEELDMIRDLRFFFKGRGASWRPFFYFLSDWYNIGAIYSTNDKTNKYEKKYEKKMLSW